MQQRFEPTPEQRDFVTLMAGFRMTHQAMASIIRNPRTSKPISENTLAKAFREELATAKTKVQATILTKYFEALGAGSPWAIQWGLRHYLGYREDATIAISGESAITKGIEVRFVTPDPAKYADQPMPGPYDPRPISKAEHYDAANVTHPRLIQHEPAPTPAPKGKGWMK